jgi:hypothetical protein
LTERTIKNLAVELAAQSYDFIRSHEKTGEKVDMRWGGKTFSTIDPLAFGRKFPTFKHWLNADPPCWMHFYEMARQMLVAMLNRPDVPEHRKQQIMDALVEDREKQQKQEAMNIKSPKITQRHSLGPRN